MTKQYIAIDQYGQTYHELNHPRKDLLARLGCSQADKMYQDNKKGESFHVGYIIADLWLTVYEITPMQKVAN